jgi:hypothetical protein
MDLNMQDLRRLFFFLFQNSNTEISMILSRYRPVTCVTDRDTSITKRYLTLYALPNVTSVTERYRALQSVTYGIYGFWRI